MNRKDISNIKAIREEENGYSTKYWIYDGKYKLVKYNEPTCIDGDIMEKLASDILNNIGINAVNVELGYNSDQAMLEKIKITDPNCALIESYLEEGETDININKPLPKVNTGDEQKNISSCFFKTFNLFNQLPNINETDLEKLKNDYIRLVFGDIIINNEDRHLKNVEIIYNENNATYVLAPSFDNAQSFNAYSIGAEDGYAYVGNQDFPNDEIIKYITNHYLDVIGDITDNLDYLVQNLPNLLEQYADEIAPNKMKFIYTYLNNINDLTKENINQNENHKQM